MSSTLCVRGYIPPDEKWKKMKAVWDSCKKAGIDIPKEVEEFFGYSAPDPAGIELELPIKEWTNRIDASGFELNVKDIPKHVQLIRFYVQS